MPAPAARFCFPAAAPASAGTAATAGAAVTPAAIAAPPCTQRSGGAAAADFAQLQESLRQLSGAMARLPGAAPEASAKTAGAPSTATFGDAPSSLLGHMSDAELEVLVKRVRERLK